MTGKPREEPADVDINMFDNLSDDEDSFMHEIYNQEPDLLDEGFQKYLEERRQSETKLEELYGDDEPYEAIKDEEQNEET